MMNADMNRRQALQWMGVATAGTAIKGKSTVAATDKSVANNPKYVYCLNMSTIRGQNLGFMKELEVAAAAGFTSVEIWIDSMTAYLNKGGTLRDVKSKLNDLGLKVEDCICFHQWAVNDEPTRKAALEQMKRDMETLAELGCRRMAATGKGTTNNNVPPMDVIAERYRTILEIGQFFHVVPQLEMWGFLKNFQNVAEVVYNAMESRHPAARVLLDIFHLYRGNSSLEMLKLMSPNAVEMFHMNDYPAGYGWQTITDADRIYPGDGVAPIKQTLSILLKDRNMPLVLSCELFNKSYYDQDALTVAKTSLLKMKAIVNAL